LAKALGRSLQLPFDVAWYIPEDARLQFPGNAAAQQVWSNIWRWSSPALAPFGAELRR
jgi:hypothetical protein